MWGGRVVLIQAYMERGGLAGCSHSLLTSPFFMQAKTCTGQKPQTLQYHTFFSEKSRSRLVVETQGSFINHSSPTGNVKSSYCRVSFPTVTVLSLKKVYLKILLQNKYKKDAKIKLNQINTKQSSRPMGIKIRGKAFFFSSRIYI